MGLARHSPNSSVRVHRPVDNENIEFARMDCLVRKALLGSEPSQKKNRENGEASI
ncbi:hypothetical protein CA13_10930 [Planctomycetes bacterium CA13]|uniref:Uncharacterized protein n=1 Tax=Novipirellula herctigrandis TaxID=2527986 RepID=A0A5C5YYN2_9BACT|nr:hypothetical protein CA13_10930 [Planctomycetes bacterium CA13]